MEGGRDGGREDVSREEQQTCHFLLEVMVVVGVPARGPWQHVHSRLWARRPYDSYTESRRHDRTSVMIDSTG